VALTALPVLAGGGAILQDDVCKMKIGFYEAHVTVYQPETSGNKQFCTDYPDIGPTIFVFDYLHDSMKEVPIDFRIMRDVTDLGRFVRPEDVVALGDLEKHTIFYQAPSIEGDASLMVEPVLPEKGSYIGIVTAGHPTNDIVYTAVFPFEVGAIDISFIFPFLAFLAPALLIWFIWRVRTRRVGEA
jgi:hypothetical protein